MRPRHACTAEAQELRYLTSLLAAAANESDPPAAPAGLRWESMAQALQARPALLPSLAAVIRTDEVPSGLWRPLEERIAATRRHGAMLSLELARIGSALHRAGLDPLVLKGPALAGTVYPDPQGRYFADLDVLVRPESLDPAGILLERLGYQPATTLAHAAFYERHHFHRIYVSRAGVRLELHWELTQPLDYVRFDLAGLRTRARTLSIGKIPVQIPAASDLLLHSAYQALNCTFSDLRRVLDAALLLRAGAAGEPGLAERSRRQGLAPALWVLLTLARELTGVAVPERLEEAVRPPVLVRRCLASLDLPCKALSLYVSRRSGLVLLVRLLCAPSVREAVRYARHYLDPGDAFFLQRGHAPGHLPRLPGRVALFIKQLGSLGKVCAYQGWRLILLGCRSALRP